MLEWSLSNPVQRACHPVSDTCIHMYICEGVSHGWMDVRLCVGCVYTQIYVSVGMW